MKKNILLPVLVCVLTVFAAVSSVHAADLLEQIAMNAVHTVSDRFQLELLVFKKEGIPMGE